MASVTARIYILLYLSLLIHKAADDDEGRISAACRAQQNGNGDLTFSPPFFLSLSRSLRDDDRDNGE